MFIIGHLRGASTRKVFPIIGESSEIDCNVVGNLSLPGKDQWNRVYATDGLSPTLTTMQGGRQEPKIIQPVFTLTAQDRHGVSDAYRIRKLTPKECWRLQGFPDELFEKAAKVNSDSQLYKQAGNSVTVNVIYEIAKKF